MHLYIQNVDLFKKHILPLALLLLLMGATTIAKVLWQENKPLTKQHFKGPVDTKSKFMSNTNTTLNIRIIKQRGVTAEVTNYFDPAKSWIKPNATNEILKHEQLHFDITEIYARELRKRIKHLQKNTSDADVLNMEIKFAFKQYARLMEKEQTRYDSETNHSIIIDMQKKWSDSVAIRLIGLNEFKK